MQKEDLKNIKINLYYKGELVDTDTLDYLMHSKDMLDDLYLTTVKKELELCECNIKELEKWYCEKFNSENDILLYGCNSDSGEGFCFDLTTCILEDFEYKLNDLVERVYEYTKVEVL